MEPVVPVVPTLPSELAAFVDPVTCVDNDEVMERDDAIECYNGDFYASQDNVADCPDCDRCTPVDELDDNDGHCERCRQRDYTACEGCGEVIRQRDCTTSEGGDDYCDSCYNERYITCAGCNGEVATDDAIERRGCLYCESCSMPSEDGEHPVPENFVNRSGCAEAGSSRCFGVELETSECNGWSEFIEDTAFGVKEDGSISGKEFVSAVLSGDDGLNAVRNLCKYANRNGFDVDSDCGYHLHIDLTNESDEELRRIALAYAYTCDFWNACVESDRVDGYYCRYNKAGRHSSAGYWDANTIKAGAGRPRAYERYVWANWQAYDRHSTLEIRLHHATLDGRAVCNWVKAHIRFVDYVKGLTVGQITRIFGNKTVKAQMRNMRDLWKDAALSDYYAAAAGVDCDSYAAA